MGKKLVNRRTFIKSTAAGVGGFFFLASNVRGEEKKQSNRKFIYRTLGKTGIKVPVIGMGMLQPSNPALVRAAFDAGINHFDTTASPAIQVNNLKMFGEVSKGRKRESFIIGIKVHSPEDPVTHLYKEGATTEAFLERFNSFLKHLDMEYVDVLYHHGVARKESAFYEPIMKAMEKAKKEGKTRFLGISAHMNVAEVVQAAADSNFYEVVMAAYNYKQKDYLQVREAIAKAANAGLGVVAIKVIRGGEQPEKMAGIRGLKEGEKAVNPRASLKWVLQDSNVHATVPAFDTFEDMNVDLSVMEDLTLTDSEKEDLKRAASTTGLYCQGCGQCVRQCIAKLPIPDLMRAYMYTYGYRKPSIGQELVVSLGLPNHVCEDCGQCPVKCLNGWNVSHKIRDIVRLRDVPSEFIA
jgi:predicted aldo/keto reductase-like oxidoreductase